MAERIIGGVNTVVGLDPAENWPGGYNPEAPGEVDFGSHSAFSWAFSDAGGLFGSDVTPGSADEAFAVENTSHGGVVDLFSNMLKGVGSADVLQYFPLSRLLGYKPGPWTPNQYDHWGNPSSSGSSEAVITADSSGAVAISIAFVTLDAAPPTMSVQSPLAPLRSEGSKAPSAPLQLARISLGAGQYRGQSAGVSSVPSSSDWPAAPNSGIRETSRSNDLEAARPADIWRVDAVYHGIGVTSFGTSDRDDMTWVGQGCSQPQLQEERDEDTEWLDDLRIGVDGWLSEPGEVTGIGS